MSINTYQVHKRYYCKSRHEGEDFVPSIPVLEAASGGLSAAFKPAADTVILRGGMNGTIAPTIIQPQAIYAAISTNPLILLPCSLVPGQGLVPQNGVISAGAPSIVLQSGIACPTVVEKSTASKIVENNCPPRKTSHPVMNTADESTDNTLLSSSKIAVLKRKISEGDVLNLKKACINNETVSTEKNIQDTKDNEVSQDSPLDLSIKFKKISDSTSRKSPVRRRSSVISVGHPASPIHRVCGSGSPPGPSVISSSHSSSPPTNSYSNESFTTQVPVVVHRVPPVVSERISPLPPVLQSAIVDKTVPTPGILPPKLMKQGNNICEECHIVFFKYDNLVTHKKHYCAYRRQQLSALAAAAAAAAASTQEQSSDDNNSNHSGNDGAPSIQADDSGKSGLRKLEYGVEHYRQVIPKPPQPVYCCDACGVKFSTSDTLEAHQTYYCMKKPDSAMAKASNRKGEESSSGNIESPFSGPEEWKCNYCDATCSSYETIRRHLLTHSELRGYRCLLCGYKGNTLRGMRTHACEHLTEDTASIEEFMSSTVISEAGVIPVIPRPLECSDEDSNQQKESMNFRHRERTSSNNSDLLKDRTIKHERVIAEFSESEELSNSPKSGESVQKDTTFKRASSLKAESGDSNSDVGSNNQETVNPLAFCDVVIKSENEVSATGDDSDRNDIKLEQDQDNDSDEKTQSRHPRSVIRVAEKHEDIPHSSKRKNKSHPKSNSDLKSCKTCGVSFQHLSNLLTHKKYYCSRTLQNCLPETATVQ